MQHFDAIALALLLVAAAFPATAPTVPEQLAGTGANFWQLRIGPASAFEIGVVAISFLWLARLAVVAPRTNSFDRPLIAASLAILGLQALALPGHLADANFIPLDVERVLIPAAGYVIASRCIADRRALKWFTWALGAVVAVRAFELVALFGITGKTEFGTITGRDALLITEDSLLLILPAALAWGAFVDGRIGIWGMSLTVGLISSVVLIDILSLRRGALIMIGSALIVRSITAGRRRILQGTAAIVLVLALAVVAGPARSLVPDVKYAAKSAFLQSSDDSSDQRTAELRSFGDNVNGTDWVTGRGFGVIWRAYESAPVDALSFGDGETAFTRIGWHIYFLDWAYKIGLAGIVIALLAGWAMLKDARRSYRSAEPELRTLMFSVAVCIPALVLLAFTNPRVALFAGILLGILSRCCDLSGQTTTSPTNFTGSGNIDSSTSSAAA